MCSAFNCINIAFRSCTRLSHSVDSGLERSFVVDVYMNDSRIFSLVLNKLQIGFLFSFLNSRCFFRSASRQEKKRNQQ